MASSSAISIQLVADSVVGCDSGLTIYTREGPVAREDEESDADVARDVFATASEPKQLWTVPGGRHTDALMTHAPIYRPRLVAFFRACLEAMPHAGRALSASDQP